MNLADILKLAGLTQQEPMSSLSSPGSSCNQHMNPDDMRTLVVKIEQPQLQPEQEMVATEEAEGSYANAPEEKEVGDTHNDFSFKGFGKRKRHTRDALGNYGDNPLEESNMFEMYKNFKLDEAPTDIDAKYKELGLDQGDDPLGGWYDTMGMSDQEIAAAKQKRINDRLAQMARDEGGGGIVSGDYEKGQAINKANRMTAADASLDRGTQTSDFGQQQIAKRDASWEKGIDNPSTQDVARSKPRQVVKPKLATSTSTLNPNVSPSTSVSQPAQVASPKPPVEKPLPAKVYPQNTRIRQKTKPDATNTAVKDWQKSLRKS